MSSAFWEINEHPEVREFELGGSCLSSGERKVMWVLERLNIKDWNISKFWQLITTGLRLKETSNFQRSETHLPSCVPWLLRPEERGWGQNSVYPSVFCGPLGLRKGGYHWESFKCWVFSLLQKVHSTHARCQTFYDQGTRKNLTWSSSYMKSPFHFEKFNTCIFPQKTTWKWFDNYKYSDIAVRSQQSPLVKNE